MSDKTVITIEDKEKGSFGHPGGFRFRFQSYEKGKLVAGVEKFMPVDVPSVDPKNGE